MATTQNALIFTRQKFTLTGQHLAAALDKFSVPKKEKNELLAEIGPMQGDIAGK